MRRILVSLGLALTLAACASKGTAASDPGSTRQSSVKRQNVITTEEIAEHRSASSVQDLVNQLRPTWSRDATIFVNNDPLGSFAMASQLAAGNTKEIRFLTASEAQMKWGSRFKQVIQVITK